jgi:hypothetical protein
MRKALLRVSIGLLALALPSVAAGKTRDGLYKQMMTTQLCHADARLCSHAVERVIDGHRVLTLHLHAHAASSNRITPIWSYWGPRGGCFSTWGNYSGGALLRFAVPCSSNGNQTWDVNFESLAYGWFICDGNDCLNDRQGGTSPGNVVNMWPLDFGAQWEVWVIRVDYHYTNGDWVDIMPFVGRYSVAISTTNSGG